MNVELMTAPPATDSPAAAPSLAASFPTTRLRRLRRSSTLRRLVREISLEPADFIYPMFIVHGQGVRREVTSMPGVYQLSVDQLAAEAAELKSLGIPAVMLFGRPTRTRWG